ncbi:hypothetical protein [Sphingobium aromaticiconvertens]
MTTTIIVSVIIFLGGNLLGWGIVRGGALREQRQDREDEQP